MQISLQIFKTFEITLMLLSGGWGKKIHEKNLKQKFPDTVLFSLTLLNQWMTTTSLSNLWQTLLILKLSLSQSLADTATPEADLVPVFGIPGSS
jgi:hypothetical protein